MRCRGVQGVANPAYLRGIPFPRLQRVAPYCVPGGVRMVSISPSYLDKGSLVLVLRPSSQGNQEPQRRSTAASHLTVGCLSNKLYRLRESARYPFLALSCPCIGA